MSRKPSLDLSDLIEAPELVRQAKARAAAAEKRLVAAEAALIEAKARVVEANNELKAAEKKLDIMIKTSLPLVLSNAPAKLDVAAMIASTLALAAGQSVDDQAEPSAPRSRRASKASGRNSEGIDEAGEEGLELDQVAETSASNFAGSDAGGEAV